MADDNYAREDEGIEEEELDETVSAANTVILHGDDHNSHVIETTELPFGQGCRSLRNRRQQLHAETSSLERPQETR